MKAPRILTIILAGITAVSTLDGADKTKKTDLAGYPFWTEKKRGYVPQFTPGLTAALQLTETQREQVAAANDELSNDPAVKAAKSISKSDPSVTAEQRDQARAAIEAATTRLRNRVAAILTPEQTALIEKVNQAYGAAAEEIGIVYEDKFGSVKDQAVRRKIQEEKNQDIEEQFLLKLDSLLSASQKEAMARAAEAEMQRAKAVADKKPAK